MLWVYSAKCVVALSLFFVQKRTHSVVELCIPSAILPHFAFGNLMICCFFELFHWLDLILFLFVVNSLSDAILSQHTSWVYPPFSKISFEKDGFIILYFYFKNNVFSTISMIIFNLLYSCFCFYIHLLGFYIGYYHIQL